MAVIRPLLRDYSLRLAEPRRVHCPLLENILRDAGEGAVAGAVAVHLLVAAFRLDDETDAVGGRVELGEEEHQHAMEVGVHDEALEEPAGLQDVPGGPHFRLGSKYGEGALQVQLAEKVVDERVDELPGRWKFGDAREGVGNVVHAAPHSCQLVVHVLLLQRLLLEEGIVSGIALGEGAHGEFG